MEEFRHIGKNVGSLRALMVLKHEIHINQRQCCLLLDMYEFAFVTISEEIRQNLRFDERSTKWKCLELPMEELRRIIKEGVEYIKYCIDIKDWWGKVMSLHMNKDCIEFHIHNLMCCFPVVIEAIETAAEISGFEEEVMLKRRFAYLKKYNIQCNNPKLFQWMFGKQYLMPREVEIRLEKAWKEDRWLLLEMLMEKKNSNDLAKHEQRLRDLLIKKLDGSSANLLPSSALVGASDYITKRRLGTSGNHVKEIHWLGENFALKTIFCEIEPLLPEINLVLSLSHPNIMQYICGFYDGERKEGLLVMDLMSKSLDSYVKENCGQRKRAPFSLPVVLDIMLQIARGMEYLHSKGIYHGELNPSHILLKQRGKSPEGYYLAKITGMVLNRIRKTYRNSPNNANDGVEQVWYAPEVVEQNTSKFTEKADVYSFGMLCFLLLTGKVPFEDAHLQGEKMVRNIKAGERPLFPYPSPRYLVTMTRKCWQSNPAARPSFSSICRILRYIKKTLIINPDHGRPESPPPFVDYCEIEAGYHKKIVEEIAIQDFAPVSQIPFQLFAYRLVEQEKTGAKDRTWSFISDNNLLEMDGGLIFEQSDRRSVHSEITGRRNSMYGVDQRSVTSEMPQMRRFFESDQRSLGSESPGRRFFSLKNVDLRQASVAMTTHEMKVAAKNAPAPIATITSPKGSSTSSGSITYNQAEKNETSIPVSPVSRNPEKTTVDEENMKIQSSDEGKNLCKVPLMKSLVKKRSMRTLSDIPEDINLLSATPRSKSVDSKGNTSARKRRPVSLVKKAISAKKTEKEGISEGKQKSMKITNTKQDSLKVMPGSSPGRIFRRISMSLANSPARVDKNTPSSSPARTFRRKSMTPENLHKETQSSSPARVQTKVAHSAKPEFVLRDTSSSPKHPSLHTITKGYLSPRQSPLHRCTRYDRARKDNSLPVGSSPLRQKIDKSPVPWIV